MTMGQLDDYNFLLARLSRRYDPPEREEAHRAELRARTRRRNESADEFAENLKNLAQRAYTSADQNMLDNIVVERFREGHGNEELKKHLCLYPSTGIQDLIGACVRFETHVEIGSRAHKSNEGLYTVQGSNQTELTLDGVTRAARKLWFTLRLWIDRQQNNRGFNNAAPSRNQNRGEQQQSPKFNQNPIHATINALSTWMSAIQPRESWYLAGWIRDSPIDFLVDPGAVVSAISLQCYEKLVQTDAILRRSGGGLELSSHTRHGYSRRRIKTAIYPIDLVDGTLSGGGYKTIQLHRFHAATECFAETIDPVCIPPHSEVMLWAKLKTNNGRRGPTAGEYSRYSPLYRNLAYLLADH